MLERSTFYTESASRIIKVSLVPTINGIVVKIQIFENDRKILSASRLKTSFEIGQRMKNVKQSPGYTNR
jgi:hypothetical protein